MAAIPPIFIAEAAFGLALIPFLASSLAKLPPRARKTEGRIVFFDAARGLAILLVIAMHATTFVPALKSLHDLLWFALPLFVIASGYLLTLRYGDGLDPRRYASSVLSRVIVIYLLFTLILRVYLGERLTPLTFLLNAAFGRENGNLYFIPLIILLYAAFPLIIRLERFLEKGWAMTAVFLLSYAFFLLDFFVQRPAWNSNELSLIFPGRFLFYFCFGIVLARRDISSVTLARLRVLLPIYIAGVVAFSLHAGKFYATYLYPAMAFLALLVVYNAAAAPWLSSALSWAGRLSLVIYIAHTRFLYDVAEPLRNAMGLEGIGAYLFLLVTTAALSCGFAWAFMRAYSRLAEAAKGRSAKTAD